MSILHALLLGIVEGITEFLPISSTAHLTMVSDVFGLAATDFLKSFQIAIQLGAILAVVVLYARLLVSRRQLWRPILAAFIPTGVIGFVLYKIIKQYLLGNSWIVVAALALGGVVLIYFDRRQAGAMANSTTVPSDAELVALPTSSAIIIGIAQALAVIPGVSRSAATIVAGRLRGVSRVAIVEFSFLLAIPTMVAATGYDLLKSASAFSTSQVHLLAVGFLAAFVSAFIAVRFLLRYVQWHSLASFGIYRILIAAVFALYLIIGK